jgi:hypothetical protein
MRFTDRRHLMKTLRWAALAALTLTSPAAWAGDFDVPTVSVYGAIGVGSGDVVIRQNSTANFAGVMQVGPHVSAAIQQSGQYNAAMVGQIGQATSATVLQNGGSNNALVRQMGRLNNALVGQIGADNRARVGRHRPGGRLQQGAPPSAAVVIGVRGLLSALFASAAPRGAVRSTPLRSFR